MLKLSPRAMTVAIALLTGRGTSEDEVRAALDKANYCASADECERVEPPCPCGCNISVNAEEADGICRLLADFDGGCTYACDSPRKPACVDGRCETGAA
jgi:hypothetical protein